jgi:hypothetical protein
MAHYVCTVAPRYLRNFPSGNFCHIENCGFGIRQMGRKDESSLCMQFMHVINSNNEQDCV